MSSAVAWNILIEENGRFEKPDLLGSGFFVASGCRPGFFEGVA